MRCELELCPWVLSVPVVACCGGTGTVSSYSVFKKMKSWLGLSHTLWSWSLQWKQLLCWKKIMFVLLKISWTEREKKFTNYYLCYDIHIYVCHGKQFLVWNLTTKRTKCGLQLCIFLQLYITCGNVKGSCWIVRMGEGDCATSHNSIRKQLCNCLQFYQCSLWEKMYWLQKD